MNWRRLLGRHIHDFYWRTEPERGGWLVSARCACGEVSWAQTVQTNEELRTALSRSFQAGSLSASGYFTAPTHVVDA